MGEKETQAPLLYFFNWTSFYTTCFIMSLNLFLPLWIFTSLSQMYLQSFSKIIFHSFFSTILSSPCPFSFLFFSCFEISVLQHPFLQARCLSKLTKRTHWPRKEQGEPSPCYLRPLTESLLLGQGGGQTLGKYLVTPAPSHSTENPIGWNRASVVIWTFCSGTKIPKSPNQK